MKSESRIWFMFWVWITILTGGSLASLVPGSWLTKIIFPIFLISESGPLYSPGAHRMVSCNLQENCGNTGHGPECLEYSPRK